MLTEDELERAIAVIMTRLQDINVLYIHKIAAQIKKIGELGQSNINRLVIMAEMGQDVAEITQQLAAATALNTRDVYSIYQAALNDMYTDKRFKRFLTKQPLSDTARQRINWYAQNVSAQTANRMSNLSNTTAISKSYQAAVDKAIYAASTGLDSYSSLTQQVIRDIGYNGMQVEYASGHRRRLDTAVRQNIVDGVNQINQNASMQMGEELGFDAYEISAHARSAPDHEPVQGRVFLKAEFNKMQNGLPFEDVDGRKYSAFKRPIGEWNCMHIAMSFSTSSSVRRYTDEQLEEWRKANAAGCEIGGKHLTMYQASQLMRQIEAQVRREKDAANAAREAGNDEAQRACQNRINALGQQYTDVCNASGLPSQRQRMTVQGFKAVKVKS